MSYKLNLRGPSMNLQTACSTSLVAVHEACRSLRDGHCDMALAGGVSVTVPWASGYLYEPMGVRSSDGHCRSFDARAEGMVSGNGVAVVVLKRLADALADGDAVHAVIRGTAVNNDGSRKVGFTAPSIDGQAEVIAQAQSAAGVEPDSIGYVECHGTATALGDPIEVAALTRVFRERTAASGFCALASLKSNMGHLDAAAGVAGLIKAALAVEHGLIPPSLHYVSPNPEIDFAGSPFYVNTSCREWTPAGNAPRRAGVSAFGIGGTNAHAVLEQPPLRPASGPSRPWQLLQLAARSESALDAMTARLATQLKASPGTCLADAAHTLRVGRHAFEHRRAVLCRDTAEAVACLEGAHPERRWTRRARELDRPVAFLFPGQGAQYADMGRGLYRTEPVFRDVLDACFAILRDRLGLDLRPVLFPDGGDREQAAERLTATSLAQPALFCIEYALAKLWMAWGVQPRASLGHSVGEFVSACLAGVMSLEDALHLVTVRGRLMESMPAGVMLAVPLTEEALASRLASRGELWLTGVNAPDSCVVGGSAQAVAAFEHELSAAGIVSTRLHTSHAFHSGLMEGAVAPFIEEVRQRTLSAPQHPYVSTLTGDWITAAQATDPVFWGRQIREPVRYSAGIARLMEDASLALLELGPGSTLGSLARAHAGCGAERLVVASMRHPRASDDDQAILLGALGRLWIGGVAFDAQAFVAAETRRRIVLPTYPFERQRYWVERRAAPAVASRLALDDWFHAPVWRLTGPPAPPAAAPPPPTRTTPAAPRRASRGLVFGDGDRLEELVVAGLAEAGIESLVVRPGVAFESDGRQITLDPASPEHAARLVNECVARGEMPASIVHLWSARDDEDSASDARRGFFHLALLARALAEAGVLSPVRLTVVTSGVHSVTGQEALRPERALVLGVCRTLALEQPNLTCRMIDLDASPVRAAQLVAELLSSATEPVVAWRGGRRWAEAFTPVPLPHAGGAQTVLPQGSTCLVTGGLGGMGLALARALHENFGAKLVLLGRTRLPERAQWADWLARHAATDKASRAIRGVMALEQSGAEVLALSGDVTDRAAMVALLAEAERRLGPIRGVIHAAGVPPTGLLARMDGARAATVLAPKVAGTAVLMELLGERADFIVLCSSLNAVKGFPGAAAYSAANACLDAFARSVEGRPGARVVSIGWNRWRESGMAVDAAGAPLAADQGITDAEGREVLLRVLAARPGAHVLVSERDLREVLGAARPGEPAAEGAAAQDGASSPASEAHARPALATDFVAPASELERELALVWEEFFGIRPLGIHDDFFELGGHSLLAMRVVNRIGPRYPGSKLTLRALFDAPTIAGLAARLGGAAQADMAPAAGRTPDAVIPGRPAAQAGLDELDPDALAGLSDDEVASLLARLSEDGSRAP